MLAAVALALLAPSCGPSGCDRDLATAGFDGSVQSVADDGLVTMQVGSVTSGPLIAGSTVTVAFPADQVDQIRRDVGRVYRVRAGGTPDRLQAELDGLGHPCGDTKLADP